MVITMNITALSYVVFGLVLVVLFAVIIAFFYSTKRHRKVEEPKYRMLDDDDH